MKIQVGGIYTVKRGDEQICGTSERSYAWAKDGLMRVKILELRGSDRYAYAFVKENGDSLNVCGCYYTEHLIEESTQYAITKKDLEKMDFAKLDAVVLEQAVKDEIIAVLRQFNNSKKIFDDWGLGEVIEYGKGMTFLFYGSPGTGKTWAANCMAKALGQELLTIGAAEIQTSEPGGANRNIQNAFKTATSQKKVLFIDECDSLITNRQNVGMIMGSEINTLLTEIEKYEGVCILATNRADSLDEALERRISLIVEFPEPNNEQRRDIWSRLLPNKMPLESDVVIKNLAAHKLTGGQIKNCVLQAARLAISQEKTKVGLEHFETAIGRVQNSKNLLGTASSWIQKTVPADFTQGTKKSKVPATDYATV